MRTSFGWIGTILFLFIFQSTNAQGSFLRAQGKSIVNEEGEEVILRGMGLGGWMVQEGYMLQTAGFASPQHKIREVIQDLIGEEATDEFYEAWLANHMRKADVDSLKSWGFNHVRLPMHYNLYTLPIEDEPIPGEHTWLEKGFELTDSLISWCAANEMYVVLDLHAAPGGQGYDEGISDYNPEKPSLWQSEENQNKTVALWRRLAERYVDEPWVAAYDLLNEPNWDMPGNNQLRFLYNRIIESIREVDDKHIVIIEGNWFANDFTGLTPPWDDNMVYGPHKYWSHNEISDIQWVLTIRDNFNVPLYFGETGENSNTWFRDAITLFESENIGYAWWPLKKVESIAGPLSVTKSLGYQSLLNYWSGTGTEITADQGRAILMQLTEDLKIENCFYQKDVIDAMFRQIGTDETKPFKKHKVPGKINAADFDLGPVGFAYHDIDVATYQVSTGEFTPWNSGWAYRNDGVDIENSLDVESDIGYSVGFTNEGEWMQYTLDEVEAGVYDIKIRVATSATTGRFHFSVDDADLNVLYYVPVSGGFQNWNEVTMRDVVLTAENKHLKFHIDGGGFNVSSFEFVKTGETESLATEYLNAKAMEFDKVELYLNKPINGPLPDSPADFQIFVNSVEIPITDVQLDEENPRTIHFDVNYNFDSEDLIKISYNGSTIEAMDGTGLQNFVFKDVQNLVPRTHDIPGLIEAEEFFVQSGVEVNTTSDDGGGDMIEFIDEGDYVDFNVNVAATGTYTVTYRTAAAFQSGELELQRKLSDGTYQVLHAHDFPPTGSWDNWSSSSSEAILYQGIQQLRLYFTGSEFNLNWINFDFLSSDENIENEIEFFVGPNPTEDELIFKLNEDKTLDVQFELKDENGRIIFKKDYSQINKIVEIISVADLIPGIYFATIKTNNEKFSVRKIVIID